MAKTENRIQNHQETNSMVTSGVYRVHYTNTYFIKVLANAMDFSKPFVSISIFLNHSLYFCPDVVGSFSEKQLVMEPS